MDRETTELQFSKPISYLALWYSTTQQISKKRYSNIEIYRNVSVFILINYILMKLTLDLFSGPEHSKNLEIQKSILVHRTTHMENPLL